LKSDNGPGYTDSGADLAYNLRERGERVVTPVSDPVPTRDADWSFPDTISGIRSAVTDHGANVLWANTTLHSSHALVQLRSELCDRGVRMIGQNPLDTEKFEDKEWINRWLNGQPGLEGCFPRSMLFNKGEARDKLERFGVPAVAKPIRGRGSHGVTLANTVEDLQIAAERLLAESDAILLEVGAAASLLRNPQEGCPVGGAQEILSHADLTCAGVLRGRGSYSDCHAAGAVYREYTPVL
jgi:carbamoylphosphate synthase large subunit